MNMLANRSKPTGTFLEHPGTFLEHYGTSTPERRGNWLVLAYSVATLTASLSIPIRISDKRARRRLACAHVRLRLAHAYSNLTYP